MVRLLFAASLVALPIMSVASQVEPDERFGYESINLDIGAGTTNQEWLDNSNATTWTLSGNYLLSSHWLLTGDYSAQFFHPDDYTLRIDRLLVGGGYRFGVNEQLDIYATYGLGGIKAKATDDDSDRTISSDSEFLHGVTLGANYLISEKLTATAELHFNRSDVVDENNYKIAFNYQWHKAIGSGLYYQYRDTDYQGEASEHINEVGLSFKFLY